MKKNASIADDNVLTKSDHLIISFKNTKYVLPVNSILRLEATRIYTVVYVKNKEQYVCAKNLKAFCGDLESGYFFRIHKSHLINLHEVKGYKEGRGGQVIMSDNSVIEVSQRKKTPFLKRLYEIYGGNFGQRDH